MTPAERLRHFAANIEEYGPLLTLWGSPAFICEKLREAAALLDALTQIPPVEHD